MPAHMRLIVCGFILKIKPNKDLYSCDYQTPFYFHTRLKEDTPFYLAILMRRYRFIGYFGWRPRFKTKKYVGSRLKFHHFTVFSVLLES